MLGAKQAAGASYAEQDDDDIVDPVPRAPAGDQSNVTPEEQAMYDTVVKNAQQIIYTDDGQVSPVILSHLAGEFEPETMQMFEGAEPPVSKNPVDNLAVTAVALVLFLDANATSSGVDVPDYVLYHAGNEILEDLADVAQAGKIHDYSEDELEGAFYRALDLFRISSPRVNSEQLGEEFATIANADKSGQLGQLLPGLGDRMKEAA